MITSNRYYLGQPHFFYRQVQGQQLSIVSNSDRYREYYTLNLVALTILRGYPGLGPHLGAQTAVLKSLLGVTDVGVRNTEWASIVLYAAYLDHVAPLLKKDAKPDQVKIALNRMFIDTETLGEVRAVLKRYLEVINGRTLNVGVFAASPGNDASDIFGLSAIIAAAETGTILGIAVFLIIVFAPEFWRAMNFVARGILNVRYLVLVRDSDQFLENLQFSEGREAAAGFSLKGLFNFTGKRSLTARDMTLQSLTDRYQRYVDALMPHYNGKMIMIIDELDKMTDPEEVKKVLLELKGALFQNGCYYLISKSEDCAKAFRGRLIEGRNIFESTFEDVIAIRQMAPETARKMVANRLATDDNPPEIPDEAIDVMTIFSGAIPREIVRHLREVVLEPEPEDTAAKSKITPESMGLGIFKSELEQWMGQLRAAPIPGETLIQLRDRGQNILDNLPPADAPWPDDDPAGTDISIGLWLAECLSILDPGNARADEEIVSEMDIGGDDKESRARRKRFRELAVIQACLRLMIMNVLMRHLWQHQSFDEEQSDTAITCSRSVMMQPAIAERMLRDLAVDGLGLDYADAAATIIAEDEEAAE